MNLENTSDFWKPGLYVLKVQTRTGFVAESLADGKKITVNLKVMSVYYLKFQFTRMKVKSH
jgi:hypothetical protein